MLSKAGRRAVTTPQGPSDDVLWLQTRLPEPEPALRDNPSKKIKTNNLEIQTRQPSPSALRGAATSEQMKDWELLWGGRAAVTQE